MKDENKRGENICIWVFVIVVVFAFVDLLEIPVRLKTPLMDVKDSESGLAESLPQKTNKKSFSTSYHLVSRKPRL